MLQLKNITKTYVTDHFTQNALDDVTINFEKGSFTAILGESGSGKSTLLNIVSGLDKPTNGEIYLDGIDLSNLSKKNWAVYRNHYVGFIFQEYNLIRHLKVIDNVAMPLLLQGVNNKEAYKKAMEKLEMLDLVKHANKLPYQLSGGQQQRVSIARALVTDPKIIMADEPTGALDEEMGKKVLTFLKRNCSDKIIIMVTHDEELANEFSTRIIRLSDGKVIDDTNNVENRNDIAGSMSFKKPKMPLQMEFKFSLNNLFSRMGRTIFTSLTVAIGLISIFLLVFLMTGVNKTINSVVDELLPENVYSLTKDTNTELTDSELNAIKEMDYVDEVLYDINISTYGSYLSDSYNLNIYNCPEHKNNFIGNKSLKGSYIIDSNDAIITTALLSQFRGEPINNSNVETNFNIVKNDNIKVNKGSLSYSLKIVGLVESAMPAIYTSNTMALEMANDNNYKSNASIYFNTTDRNKIDKVVSNLENNNYMVTNISVDIKDAMDSFFGKAKKILVSVASVSLIVAGILVGLIVYTSVIERIKEIGILTAIGAKPSNIMQIFIFESGLIGLFSVIIAFILALLFSLLGNKIFGSMLTSLINVLGFSTKANIFRIDIIWSILVFILCIIFTSLVGIIPAFKASRLNAVNTLRRE